MGSAKNQTGIVVPSSVAVQGVGAAGEAGAKDLNAGRLGVAGAVGRPEVAGAEARDAEGTQARVVVSDFASAVKAARIAGDAADGIKTWIVLLADHSKGALDGTVLDEFEQALDEREPGVVDLVVLVDPAQAVELIAAWATTKIEAPASVLSRLPDSEGSACRYVALSGAAVMGVDGAGLTDSADGAKNSVDAGTGAEAVDDSGADRAIAASMTEFVRDNADGVRAARAKVAAAVAAGSASQALSASAELDGALDSLKEKCLEDLDSQVAKIVDDAPASAADKAEQSVPAEASEVDLEGLAKARTTALSAFVLASSKGGLGKLFAKAKLKQSGDQLVNATDAYVNGQGAELIDELTELAEPLVEEIRQGELQQLTATNATELLKQARQLAAKLRTAQSGVASKINRSWTKGAPAPREYLLVSNLAHSTLKADAVREANLFALPAGDLDGAYVLQAQYGLSKAALSA